MGLAVVVIVLLLVSLCGVDYKPYLREPYYVETAARFSASVVTNTIAHGELAAGFGRALLTPTINAA